MTMTPKSIKEFMRAYNVDGTPYYIIQAYRIYLETNVDVHHYGTRLSLSEWLVDAIVDYYESK